MNVVQVAQRLSAKPAESSYAGAWTFIPPAGRRVDSASDRTLDRRGDPAHDRHRLDVLSRGRLRRLGDLPGPLGIMDGGVSWFGHGEIFAPLPDRCRQCARSLPFVLASYGGRRGTSPSCNDA